MSTIREQSVSVTATETEDDTTHAQTGDEAHSDTVSGIADSLALSIFTAVAEQEGHSNVQLYDHLDIEALDQLLGHAHESPDSEWELTFAVEDSKVTVRSDGSFTVV